jgi:hypothetical protein
MNQYQIEHLSRHWNKPRMTCHQERENDKIIHMFVVLVVYIRMPP